MKTVTRSWSAGGPDELVEHSRLQTQELMTLFYSKWLSGEDKQEALREAAMELRAKVKARYGEDGPFYWGGFVVVGR